jgi:hypothetical protein
MPLFKGELRRNLEIPPVGRETDRAGVDPVLAQRLGGCRTDPAMEDLLDRLDV